MPVPRRRPDRVVAEVLPLLAQHASSSAPSVQWEVSSSLLPSLGRGWSLVPRCKVQSSLFLCSSRTCHPLH